MSKKTEPITFKVDPNELKRILNQTHIASCDKASFCRVAVLRMVDFLEKREKVVLDLVKEEYEKSKKDASTEE